MSRSNPNDVNAPNPAVRWFDWNGERGVVNYYDKEKKKVIEVGSDFDFILLDELSTIRGWHEPSKSGIYSNEVRDTRSDVLTVKAFKEGTLAEGLYQAISKDIAKEGGHFYTNLYIAFKHDGGGLALGSIRFKGSALSAWLTFRKAHRKELYEQAARIHGYTEDQKGRVKYRVPIFELKKLSKGSNEAAVALDETLQAYLTAYLARTSRTASPAETAAAAATPANEPADSELAANDAPDVPYDDDIPF